MPLNASDYPVGLEDAEMLRSALSRIRDRRLSDEAFFGRWNAAAGTWAIKPVVRYEYSDKLNRVQSSVKKGDYRGARQELLAYFRNRDGIPMPELQPVGGRGRHLTEALREGVYQYWTMERSLAEFAVTDQWQWHTIDLQDQLYSVYGIMDWKRAGNCGIRSREVRGFEPTLEFVTDGGTVRLTPVADTYVRAGDHAGENYGDAETLLAQEDGRPVGSATMRPYLCFDLPTVTGAVRSVKLHVHARSMGSAKEVSLLVLGQDQMRAFDEKALTWKSHTPQTFSFRGMDFDWSLPPGAEGEWLNLTSRLADNQNLAHRYAETGEEAYAYAALLRTLNFYAHRDAAYPRVLEVAGRGSSGVPVFLSLLNSRHMTPEVAAVFLKYLYQTAEVLSRSDLRVGNWATAVQTVWMRFNTYLPEFEQEGWWAANTARMAETMQATLLSDGAYVEACAGYIHGVLRGGLKAVLEMAAMRGDRLPELRESYRRLATYYRDLSMPDGRAIRWGDGGGASVRDHVLEAAEVLDDPGLLYFGTEGKKGSKPDYDSTCYPVGKVVTMRTGWLDKEGLGAFINARAGGPHSHPDALHLDVYAYGRYLLVESGTGSYNPRDPAGQWMRGTTIAHNTVEINDAAQRRGGDSGIGLTANRLFDHVEAWHGAYENFRHERRVLFVKPSHWIVSDRVRAPAGEHLYRQAWHPDRHHRAAIEAGSKKVRTRFSSGPNVQIVPADPDRVEVELADGYVESVPEQFVVYSTGRVSGDVLFDTVIYPTREGDDTPVAVQRIQASSGGVALDRTQVTALKISIGGERSALYCQSYREAGAAVAFGPYRFDGGMMYLEKDGGGRLRYLAMKDGGELSENVKAAGGGTAGGREILRCGKRVPDLGLEWKDGVLFVATSAKEIALSVYCPVAVRTVRWNGKETPFSRSGDHVRLRIQSR